jgi:hypothetical protein
MIGRDSTSPQIVSSWELRDKNDIEPQSHEWMDAVVVERRGGVGPIPLWQLGPLYPMTITRSGGYALYPWRWRPQS